MYGKNDRCLGEAGLQSVEIKFQNQEVKITNFLKILDIDVLGENSICR